MRSQPQKEPAMDLSHLLTRTSDVRGRPLPGALTRRAFLRRAAGLGSALALGGGLLSACTPTAPSQPEAPAVGAKPPAAPPAPAPAPAAAPPPAPTTAPAAAAP